MGVSENAITGGKIDLAGDRITVRVGDNVTGITALTKATSASKIKNLTISNCGLGPKHITILASTFPTAVLESLNILKNPIGDDGLKTLVEALKKSLSLGSITGITKNQTTIDFSNRELGPFDLKIIAADFAATTQFTALVHELDLSGNPITAPIDGDGRALWTSFESDLHGLQALCEALKSSKVKSIKFAECLLGPKAITALAFTLTTAVLESLDMSGKLCNHGRRDR